MEFCLAILLLQRKADLGDFSEKVVQRPDVQEMIARINFYVDPEAESAGFDKMTSILKIHLKNGKIIAGQAAFAKGSPSNPMTSGRGRRKIPRLRRYAGWPSAKIEKIIAFVRSMESALRYQRLDPLLSTEKG